MRIFLAAFRGDSAVILSSVRVAQLGGWIVLAIALWLLRIRISKKIDPVQLK